MNKFQVPLLLLLCFISQHTLQEPANITTPQVQFSFNKVPAIIQQVFWCGADGRNVIILTQQNHVYKSEDQGNTWKAIHPKLYEHGKRSAARQDQIGEVEWIKVSTTDPNILMFFGSQGVVWVSQDCGRTIKALYQGRKIDSFEFHPVQPRWGLATSLNSCQEKADYFMPFSSNKPRKNKCFIKKQLFYTTDLGDSWKLIADYVEQFDWAIVDNSHVKQGIPKTRILVVIDINASGDQKFTGGWQRNLTLMQSDDFFETSPKQLVKHGNKFSKFKDFLYVAAANSMNREISLYVSQRKTKFQEFTKAKLPLEHLQDHSYTIIDTSENATIIHVDHIGGQSKFGHVYISDVTGASFSLSLQNNSRESSGICDIDRIWGLEGIYFANAIDLQADQFFYEQSSGRKGSMSQSSIYTSKPVSGFSNASNFARDQAISSSKKRMNKQILQNEDVRLSKMKKTYATFNKGGKWELVSPPEQDSKGKSIKCKSSLGCSLHFHAASTQGVIAPLYSYQSSPGLIISNGNIGPFLETNPGVANTYLSRDGGKEWVEIAKGGHVYEFGNYGALIVMATDMQATKHVMYSWDEGLTWDYEVVSNQDIIVENIMIEPSASSQKFIVFGFMADQGQEGVIIHLDFTSMHQAACKGMFQTPGSAQSDFEEWTPYDGRQGQKCLLGKHYTYTRRKRSSKCFIDGTLPSPRMMTCECTDYDYECDQGYGRETVDSPCRLQEDLVQFKTQFLKDKDQESYSLESVKQRQCEQGSTYFISQGYRKVAGNSCYGGIDRNPKMYSCSRFSSSFSGLVILVLIAIVLIFVALVYFGPPITLIEFFRDKGSKYWDRAKQIIGGNDANNQNNMGQYDRVGFAPVPEHYDPDDFDDDNGNENNMDDDKTSFGKKKTPQNNKAGQGKDLLADDDEENQEPLEL